MDDLRTLARIGSRTWARAGAIAVVVFLAIGIPTDVVPNPVFGRSSIEVRWWDPIVLAATAALIGLILALRPSDVDPELAGLEPDDKRAVVGGAIGLFAVGCPTCNHLVVLLLGTSGALSVFQPIQPILGVASVALLVWTLRRRLSDLRAPACALPTP